jgi:hypothetical protein
MFFEIFHLKMFLFSPHHVNQHTTKESLRRPRLVFGRSGSRYGHPDPVWELFPPHERVTMVCVVGQLFHSYHGRYLYFGKEDTSFVYICRGPNIINYQLQTLHYQQLVGEKFVLSTVD